MKYTTEHKNREWDEVTIPAQEFIANVPHIISEAIKLNLIDVGCGIDDVIESPTLNFESGSIYADEMWGLKNGGVVWTSSAAGGVSAWDDERKSHVHHFYFSEQELGEFTSITFVLTERERQWLAAVATAIEADRPRREAGSVRKDESAPVAQTLPGDNQ